MTNYQILEIAIDIGFFLTVASIAVLFAILRERSIKKSLLASGLKEGQRFNSILNEAANTTPVVENIPRKPGVAEQPAIERKPVYQPAHAAVQTNRLSRAEQEFIKSMAIE